MSTVTLGLGLPREYGYVLTTTAATFFLSAWVGIRTVPFRKAAGIKHPKVYADSGDFAAAADDGEKKKALYLFNAAQRAHANLMESYPPTVLAILIAGLEYPVLSSALGATWIISRVVYSVGYTSPTNTDGKGRVYGWIPSFFSQIALWGLAGWTSIKQVL
ncbi:MICROSOMAL GLUTATHIONE S-TRANSFERASE 3 [Teratosphaeria destructans]|uniref:MICROSOMAL GLUTATHIONE S-TRANSFERASE 3 n=1 Tax=Teratosphaeria destructans TaxID=418781 RepID=A0A9W7T0K0_9PEZI|nr:MICROSOMAL GLUTATHIONE S-TRANSFERASE 3 [Teratosphaeria destructans]